jgi:sec-independent protein translocase protein TatC
MSLGNQHYSSDDFFADTRMSFGDHLEELRLHLWRAIAGFGVAMILCFFIGKDALAVLIIAPVESQLGEFYDRRVEKIYKNNLAHIDELEKSLKEKAQPQFIEVTVPRGQLADALAGRKVRDVGDPANLAEDDWASLIMRMKPLQVASTLLPAIQALGPRPSMKTMSVTEAFMVYFKVSLVCGLVISSPWVFWQIWMFVAAGLYPHEKRYVYVYLPFSLGLFLAGALACQFVVLPKAVGALLWFNEWLNLDPDLRLNEWLSFAIWMPIVFGISFQTPLVMLFLYRLGIVDIETYNNKRKMAFFLLAIFAALITPSIDALSMVFLWVPLCLLYQLGIWLCMWSPRQELEIEEPDELVGV